MTLKDLATQLGIVVPDTADDAAIAELIIKAFKDAASGASGDQPPPDPAVKASQDAATLAKDALILSLTLENRSNKIDKLVGEAKLSPAEATAWKKTYASEALSLSNTADGFDQALSLAQTRPAMFTPNVPKTGPQTSLDPKDNPTIRDAMARQKAGASY